MESMKIGIDAHIFEDFRTGTARYLLNLLKFWAKTDTDFILYFKNKVSDDIPKAKNFKMRILKSNSNTLFVHFFLPQVAKKDGVDILFCPAYVAPVFYKGKIALALHDIIYEAKPNLYNWPSIFDKILLKKVSKISAKKAEMLFACSQFTKHEIIKYYKINSKKIYVIPLAAEEKFKPIKNKEILEKIKKKYKIKNKFIFYVGALLNRRFIKEMIKAFEKISDKLPEYQFLIGGPNLTNLKMHHEKIKHIDYIDEKDLSLLYNSAGLFIWLSSYEGFGLPPLEAMACGTPVLSTKKTSLTEVLEDYPIWVENPENIDEISEKILKILKNEKLKEELVKNGLNQAKKFSWQKTAEETLRIMNQKV